MKNYKIFISLMIAFLSNQFYGQSKSDYFEVKESGNGKEVIIFIPGFACSADVWNETLQNLNKNYKCITLTMPGFAGNKPDINASFEKWKIEIANFLIENKINSSNIIGHSMGGGLALALASDYPTLVKKILIVDSLPCLNALFDINFKAKTTPDCTEIENKLVNLSDEEFQKMQKISISRLVSNIEKQDEIVSWSLKSDRKTFAKMYCDFSNTDLREKIENVQCPSLILLEANFINFKSAIENQYKNLKNTKIEYASKGLHFIMYDDTEWYNKQLNDFLMK